MVAVTLSIALLGAALGLINLWRAIDRDRINLRVRPLGYMDSLGHSGVCIEVINLSFFPVTITQVGFDLPGGKIFIHARLQQELPKRRESRAAFTAYLPAGVEQNPVFGDVRRAFAKTACGCRFAVTSDSLRSFVKAARAAQK
jgi:hypothetical protein